MTDNIKKLLIYGNILALLMVNLFASNSLFFSSVQRYVAAALLPMWLILGHPMGFTRTVGYYAAFAVWCTLSFPMTGGDWDTTFEQLRLMYLLVPIMFIVGGFATREKDLSNLALLILVYFAFTYFGGLLGLDTEERAGRLQGIAHNSNALGFICQYGMLASIYLIDRGRFAWLKPLRAHWWIPFVIFAVLILPTGSRKSLLSLVVVMLFYSAFKFRRNLAPLVFGLAVLGLIGLFLGDAIIEYFSDTIMGERFLNRSTFDRGANIRLSLIQQGIQFFFENPIAGIGLGNFGLRSYSGHQSHNYYIEILACTGIVGFVLLFSVYLNIWRQAYGWYQRQLWTPEMLFILSYLVLTASMGSGFAYYRSMNHWVFLVMISGFLWRIRNLPPANGYHR